MDESSSGGPAVKVQVPEAMTRFRCNQKGCCCKGWNVWFRPDDLVRLKAALTPEEFDDMLDRAAMNVSEDDNRLLAFHLRTVGAEEACQFLEDGKCGLQMRKGAAILPDLCRAFPAHALNRDEVFELHYSAVCPEVLERIDEGDTPFQVIDLEVEPESDLGVRSNYFGLMTEVQIGAHVLAPEQLVWLRDRILEALRPGDEPALHQLGRVNYALARLARGAPLESFRVQPGEPVEPFLEFFDRCVELHHAVALQNMLWDYRRFVFVLDLRRIDAGALLEAFQRHDWKDQVAPEDPDLQGLLRRYLSHRFFSPFSSSPDQRRLSFTYGSITHCVATAFRMAAALRVCLDDAAPHEALKVGLGASEFLYRSITRILPSSLIWFELPGESE